jgi:hypothetical protein
LLPRLRVDPCTGLFANWVYEGMGTLVVDHADLKIVIIGRVLTGIHLIGREWSMAGLLSLIPLWCIDLSQPGPKGFASRF